MLLAQLHERRHGTSTRANTTIKSRDEDKEKNISARLSYMRVHWTRRIRTNTTKEEGTHGIAEEEGTIWRYIIGHGGGYDTCLKEEDEGYSTFLGTGLGE